MKSINRKIILSIAAGLLCFFLSHYGIEIKWDAIDINLPWSILFPIIISLSYGWKFGLISGLSGGALFPFYLWLDNGLSNFVTFLIYLNFYMLLGLINHDIFCKKIKNYFLRTLILLFSALIVYKLYYTFLFNHLLALNPYVFKDAITHMPQEIIDSFFVKDSINFTAYLIVANVLLKIPQINKFLGLDVSPYSSRNTFIFLMSLGISIFIWLSFTVLGHALLRGENVLRREHITLALLVIVTSGFITSLIIIYFSESQIRDLGKLNESEGRFKVIINTSPI